MPEDGILVLKAACEVNLFLSKCQNEGFASQPIAKKLEKNKSECLF